MRSAIAAAGLYVVWSVLAAPAVAEDEPGITATEIRIGQTMPYSGPVSAFGILGKGEVAYFKMVNDRGGIKRPQNQPALARRQLRAAQDRGADAPADRERRGLVHLFDDGDRA
jgi:ABC-type branched-subunit amino acid transport system substrate-binding protein